MSTDIATVEGNVLDGPTFVNLYRLLDLERSAIEEAQGLTMPAAAEILTAYESHEWRDDKQREWDAYVADRGYVPQWSPTSKEQFYKWVIARAERDGHPFTSRARVQQLVNAATARRAIPKSNRAATRVAALIDEEKSWRPTAKLLNMGEVGISLIPQVVERAAELAEEQGHPKINEGVMAKARTEILRNAPELQRISHPDQASSHDKAIKARQEAERWVKALLRTNDWREIDAFDKWYAASHRNITASRKAAQR